MNTEIIAILDRSGSMGSTINSARHGFNDFLAEQWHAEGEARVTVVLFDDRYELVRRGVPLRQCEALKVGEYTARGYTALNDAIGRTLETEGARIAGQKWADNVIVCIVTDGGENASSSYSPARVKEMVTHAEAHGWKFVYLAANVDAFATGAALGISAVNTMTYDSNPTGTRSAYATMSGTVAALRAAPTMALGLVPEVPTPGIVVAGAVAATPWTFNQPTPSK